MVPKVLEQEAKGLNDWNIWNDWNHWNPKEAKEFACLITKKFFTRNNAVEL